MRKDRRGSNERALKKILQKTFWRDEWAQIIPVITDFVYHDIAHCRFDSHVPLGIYWDFTILATPMVAGFYKNSTAESSGVKIGYQAVSVNSKLIIDPKTGRALHHIEKRDDWYRKYIKDTEQFEIIFRETIQRTMDTEVLGVCSTHPGNDGKFTMMICDGKFREVTMHRSHFKEFIWRGYYYLLNKKRLEILKQYDEPEGRILRYVVDMIYGKRYVQIAFKCESEWSWGCAVNFNSNIGPRWKVKLTSKDQWYRKGVREGWTVVAVNKVRTEYWEDHCEKLLQYRKACKVVFCAKPPPL